MENLLITTPHSSTYVPQELLLRFALTQRQIWEGSDPGTKETADLAVGNDTNLVLASPVNRMVVDLNRNADDLSPIGVCRVKDFKQRLIYKEGQGLTPEEKAKYIEQFHKTWHEEFLKRLNRSLHLHIDFHNTDELNREKNAYFPGERVRMLDYTDFDISNRSELLKPDIAVDNNGLTFPSGEISGVIDSIRTHMGDFFETVLKQDRGTLRVTASGYWRGGPNIQKARDNTNWHQGTPRSLQFELHRRFFINEAGKNDMTKITGLSAVLQKVIDDILRNTI